MNENGKYLKQIDVAGEVTSESYYYFHYKISRTNNDWFVWHTHTEPITTLVVD